MKTSNLEMVSTEEMPPPPKRTRRRYSHTINGKTLTSRKGGFTGMEIPIISFISRPTGRRDTTTAAIPSPQSTDVPVEDEESNKNRKTNSSSSAAPQKILHNREDTPTLETSQPCTKRAKEASGTQQQEEASTLLNRAQSSLADAQEAYQCAQISRGRSIIAWNDAQKQYENAEQYVANVAAAAEQSTTTTTTTTTTAIIKKENNSNKEGNDDDSRTSTSSSFHHQSTTPTSSISSYSKSTQHYVAEQYRDSAQSSMDQAKMAKEKSEVILNQCTKVLDEAQKDYDRIMLAMSGTSIEQNDIFQQITNGDQGETEDPLLIQTLTDHTGPVTALTSVDETRFLSCSQDETIKLWSSASNDSGSSNSSSSSSSSSEEDSDQNGEHQCSCIDTYKDQPSTIQSISTLGNGMFVCPDTDKQKQGIALWEVASGEPLDWFPGHAEPVLAIAGVDKKSFVSSSKDYTIRLWTLESSATSLFIGHGGPVGALSPVFGHQFISGSTDSTVKLWDLSTGLCVRTFRGHADAVLAVKSFGKFHFLSGSADQKIKLFDLLSGRCIRTFSGHGSSITSLAAINDYKFLSASADKTIKLWNSTTGECLHTYRGHTEPINSIIYMGHRKFASCSNDGTIKMWKIPSQ